MGVPLHHRSAHPISTHLSWPTAEMNRLANRSSSVQMFRNARTLFLERFRSHYADPTLIDHIVGYDPIFRVKGEQRSFHIFLPLWASAGLGPIHPNSATIQGLAGHGIRPDVQCAQHTQAWRKAGSPLSIRTRT